MQESGTIVDTMISSAGRETRSAAGIIGAFAVPFLQATVRNIEVFLGYSPPRTSMGRAMYYVRREIIYAMD